LSSAPIGFVIEAYFPSAVSIFAEVSVQVLQPECTEYFLIVFPSHIHLSSLCGSRERPFEYRRMRSLMTRLVVEPTRSSLMHDWLSSELEQCGFDGNYTSRCIFNIVDRQADSGPRIGSCPTMSLWAWDEADCAPRPSSATTPEVRSGRRSWSASSDEELKREAVIDLLRLMVSTEVCRSVVFVFLTFDFTALTDLLCHVTGLACLSVCLYVCSFISLYDISYACIF